MGRQIKAPIWIYVRIYNILKYLYFAESLSWHKYPLVICKEYIYVQCELHYVHIKKHMCHIYKCLTYQI